MDDPLDTLNVFMFYEAILCIVLGVNAIAATQATFRQRCCHVAVARRGVYVDLVAEPGSRHIMNRVFVPFDKITHCDSLDMGWSQPMFYPVLKGDGISVEIHGMVASSICGSCESLNGQECSRLVDVDVLDVGVETVEAADKIV